jgi:hypothetical protein
VTSTAPGPGVVTAARAGIDGPVVSTAVGLGLLAAALAFHAWLSVAKPWGRTPRGRRAQGRLSTAPVAVIAMMVVMPLFDIPLGVLISAPLPAFSILGLIAALVVCRRRGRRGTVADTGSPTGPADVVVVCTVVRRVVVVFGVVSLRVAPADGSPVPAWEPGAHIDLLLAAGKDRQYSLHGDPADRACYDVAVLREPEGSGRLRRDSRAPGGLIGQDR